jgi:hypothetical protein
MPPTNSMASTSKVANLMLLSPKTEEVRCSNRSFATDSNLDDPHRDGYKIKELEVGKISETFPAKENFRFILFLT